MSDRAIDRSVKRAIDRSKQMTKQAAGKSKQASAGFFIDTGVAHVFVYVIVSLFFQLLGDVKSGKSWWCGVAALTLLDETSGAGSTS